MNFKTFPILRTPYFREIFGKIPIVCIVTSKSTEQTKPDGNIQFSHDVIIAGKCVIALVQMILPQIKLYGREGVAYYSVVFI